MKRKASARWEGAIQNGKGTISTDSGALSQTQYSFSTRFENGAGTNPEELIAAAHAACFSMALSGQLGKANLQPESIDTTATVTLDKTDAGWTITEVHLDVTARVPGRATRCSGRPLARVSLVMVGTPRNLACTRPCTGRE